MILFFIIKHFQEQRIYYSFDVESSRKAEHQRQAMLCGFVLSLLHLLQEKIALSIL